MRTVLTLIAILTAALFAPAPAPAAIRGDWGAYAVIASRFHTPLPDAYVHTDACPDSEAGPCANPSTGEAWIEPIYLDRITLAHELGHLYDGQYLTDFDHGWLTAVMHAPRGDWWKPYGAAEWFADYYADCAVYGGRPRHSSPETYLSERPSARRVARVCRFILSHSTQTVER